MESRSGQKGLSRAVPFAESVNGNLLGRRYEALPILMAQHCPGWIVRQVKGERWANAYRVVGT